MNYIFDSILITMLAVPLSSLFFVLFMKFNTNAGLFSTFALVQFLYYFIFELSSGQTIGKKITKTKVVPVKGKRTFFKIFIRSLTRLIFFDKLSFLFGHITGMHDQYSGTYVIKE